ncbi:AAA family ATPase [Leifsonia sp. TF02-11]|uniref:AAA family ATPase n=1 Tax=Leifsonia sp. TF02-11 TaxID=2815212 RepID=UPI0027DD60DE|nr:AAA family ATPase [Leifsonia sp. TF02-11]
MKQAVQYAFAGVCDAALTAKTADGVIAAVGYADAVMTRYIVEDGSIRDDLLTRSQLKKWVDGIDPLTGERRGRDLESPVADLILDATINAPKSYSIAAMLDPELATAYEDLQDRLRDRIIKLWQTELNARRGKQGCIREDLSRVEVVELRHERSRSLDPHKHRHLWLNVKVQGRDGRWSNVDTRVALRFQNVVNAEGDLASRTDPGWLAALAAKGFSLDANGEIAQLTHLVRPLSKRSAQIEANKVARVAEWKEQHPEQEPSHEVLNQIDRWAWAYGRPDKPANLDTEGWAAVIRNELLTADPTLGRQRVAALVADQALGTLDLDLLAAKAIVDADARSTGTGGRFSEIDVRAGVIRALAESGIIAARSELAPLIDRLEEAAAQTHTVTLLNEPGVPRHIKHLMATSTAALKASVARRVELIATPGRPLAQEEVTTVAMLVDPHHHLNAEQVDGAAALGGSGLIVCVSGAAGTGKTTMLKVAGAALRRRGKNMIIVAPTKKASSVAGREANSASSSLHQLLRDWGWRWSVTPTGETAWNRLAPGEIDPDSGVPYGGPTRPIAPGDRIVVDEAGMMELETANALLDIVRQTHASVALVGDQRQALPVGHSGAMAIFWRRASSHVELTSIHRFKDPEWAELSLRLRDPRSLKDANGLADELIDTGHVIFTNSDALARERMVDAWFSAKEAGQSISLVTATHMEAQAVNEAIQSRRLALGSISGAATVTGQDGQLLMEGDMVQTRRNDSQTGVENRQSWTIKSITTNGVVLASPSDASDLRRVSQDYVGKHVHLGYASTVYGVQGETSDRSVVGPGVDSAGLYVGLTRGRESNDVIVVAPTKSAARTELMEMMQRRPIEASIGQSRAAAEQELRHAATVELDSALTAAPAATSTEASMH